MATIDKTEQKAPAGAPTASPPKSEATGPASLEEALGMLAQRDAEIDRLNRCIEDGEARMAALLASPEVEPPKQPRFKLRSKDGLRQHVSAADNVDDAVREFNGTGQDKVYTRSQVDIVELQPK